MKLILAQYIARDMSLKVVSVCFSLEDKRQTALGRGELRKGPKSACVYVRGHARASWPGRREATCACAFLLSELELLWGSRIFLQRRQCDQRDSQRKWICRVFTIVYYSYAKFTMNLVHCQ